MKRMVASSLGSFVMASALVAAQAATPPPTSPAAPAGARTTVTTQQPSAAVVITDDKDKATMVTGCLVQGSGPTVFLLENAKTASQGSSETGKTYVVTKAASASSVDFMKNLNHKVSISGSAEDVKVVSLPSDVKIETNNPEPGKVGVTVSTEGGADKKDEKLLPKLTAQTIVSLGDTCTAPVQ